jgi:hypothetical protein
VAGTEPQADEASLHTKRDKLAREFYDAFVKQAEELAECVVVPLERIDLSLNEARLTESDRACAIAIFALVDDLMIGYFKHFLNSEMKGGLNDLFSRNGTLSTSNSRITMAIAMFFIREETASKLNIMRKIRNEFAHNASTRSFLQSPVRELLVAFRKLETQFPEKTKLNGHVFPEDIAGKELFFVLAGFTIAALCHDMIVLPAAKSLRVMPGSLFGSGSFDEMPENIKNVARVRAEAVRHFLAEEVPTSMR